MHRRLPTGNHDEILRKFEGFKIGSFDLRNKKVISLKKEKVWIFHGDAFDVTMQHSKWLAKFGAIGYDLLIMINQVINFISESMGRGRISLSKRVKNSVKGAVKFINQFETTATQIAADNGYKYVVCGHIHQPEIKQYETDKGPVIYLNSGDWIENLTALEYHKGEWSIYRYSDEEFPNKVEDDTEEEYMPGSTSKELFGKMVKEMLVAGNGSNGISNGNGKH